MLEGTGNTEDKKLERMVAWYPRDARDAGGSLIGRGNHPTIRQGLVDGIIGDQSTDGHLSSTSGSPLVRPCGRLSPRGWPKTSQKSRRCAFTTQEFNDATKYGPFCELFICWMRHETDPSKTPAESPTPRTEPPTNHERKHQHHKQQHQYTTNRNTNTTSRITNTTNSSGNAMFFPFLRPAQKESGEGGRFKRMPVSSKDRYLHTTPVPARHVSTDLFFFAQPDAQHNVRNGHLSGERVSYLIEATHILKGTKCKLNYHLRGTAATSQRRTKNVDSGTWSGGLDECESEEKTWHAR